MAALLVLLVYQKKVENDWFFAGESVFTQWMYDDRSINRSVSVTQCTKAWGAFAFGGGDLKTFVR